jgi:integrase/recombinase XerD
MIARTISQLRQRMIDDMTARQLGPQTRQHYIRGCKRFAAFLGRSPETACADDIRRFMTSELDKGHQSASATIYASGLDFLRKRQGMRSSILLWG